LESISLIVHGGAGDILDEEVGPSQNGIRQAAQIGWNILQKGGSALDAVEASINYMEETPVFDAGRGSFPNTAGEIELDAIIMDGKTLRSGAVAGIQHVLHPVSVARLVMERTPHSLFVAHGAEEFARTQGIPYCSNDELNFNPYRPVKDARSGHDTVGAIARDAGGHLAVATSTGGIPDKWPGRVGDSPLIGCGAYADDHVGGASGTGHGEDLMKIIFSKSACDLLAAGTPVQLAADQIIARLEARVNGEGGIILMDMDGNTGFAFNARRMSCAWIIANGEIEGGVFDRK
jgi:L-asparaginase / beta-aspartyl-peptidase